MSDDQKHAAAKAALAEIDVLVQRRASLSVDGPLKIGLGTGSTAKHFVDFLGERVAQGLDCHCVATSVATATQAQGLNIPLSSLDDVGQLDITFDGADEIDGDLILIKGAGGALLHEKIVAAASDQLVIMADASKKVTTLGAFALPIEVNMFGLQTTQRALATLCAQHQDGVTLTLRSKNDGNPFVTDGGHYIIDASFGRISAPEKLATDLNAIPGVVEHGLFIGMATCAYVAGPNGVEKITRATQI